MRTYLQGIHVALVLVLLNGLGSESVFGAAGAQGQNIPTNSVSQAAPVAGIKSSVNPTVASRSPMKIDYRDGLLTIDAQGSRLVDVLKLVSEKTGVSIHVPAGSGLEPIVEHAGPAPIKSVLEHLLNGSPFNFVIVNSAQGADPKQILLTLQGGSSPQLASQPTPLSAAPSVLWTPPDTSQMAIPLSAEVDDTLVTPKEAMSPEAMSEFMRQKERELRDKSQQLYPQ
jgi:hypothetical protein